MEELYKHILNIVTSRYFPIPADAFLIGTSFIGTYLIYRGFKSGKKEKAEGKSLERDIENSSQ